MCRFTFSTLFACLIVALTAFARETNARADDRMFPPTAGAKPFIDFDGRGFLVHGQRTFIASGSLHYSRVPRALWRDRLLRMKRAGFNTVQTYAFWNFHEPRESQWDFTGDHDLDAFLKIVKDLGMYATVRVGPYVCAEWDSGGYPVWLRFKPGVRVREDNAPFIAAVDKWLEKVMPIVARNQIDRGGSVILVQLENEHPQGWGRDMPNNYFRHLRDKALALGLEVPHFFSGLHHGADPAGNRAWDSVGRDTPWYTTEFWPGWYDIYGPLDPGRFLRFDRGTWKILAYGGNGYNFYMLHGGTNFASWNNDEDASSYDYGGAIGQAGDLRPIYYRFKRASLFARAFQDVLEDSQNATAEYTGAATEPSIRVTARRSLKGTILFLDNPGTEPVKTQVRLTPGGELLPTAGPLTLVPGEIIPVIRNWTVAPGIVLAEGVVRVLGIAHQGAGLTTLVVYGTPGEGAFLRFVAPNGNATISPVFREGTPGESSIRLNGQRVRVIAVSGALADRTWFVSAGGNEYVVCGPSYVGEARVENGRLRFTTERAWATPSESATVYGPGSSAPVRAVSPFPEASSAPTLSAWQTRSAADEARPGYDDRKWLASGTPLQMGADGDWGAYAWYRATLPVPKAGTYALNFADAGDWLRAFVDGKPVGETTIRRREQGAAPRTIPDVALTAGAHTLAVFTAHYGRNKLFNYLGPLDVTSAKGLNGPVSLGTTPSLHAAVTGWRWKPSSGPDELPAAAIRDSVGWQAPPRNGDVFHGQRGYAWLRATLPATPQRTENLRLHFEDVDDNATVYLNGQKIGTHEGWGAAFDVPLPVGATGGSDIVVLVQNTDGAGGITGPVEVQASASDDVAVTGWRMRGGTAAPDDSAPGWQRAATNNGATGVPTLFRTGFTLAAIPGDLGPHPILRVTTTGLSRGFVYLNGHNLGRYPEKVNVQGIYLPECWLRKGQNTLAVIDEEGYAPTDVRLVIEQAASRVVAEWETTK